MSKLTTSIGWYKIEIEFLVFNKLPLKNIEYLDFSS